MLLIQGNDLHLELVKFFKKTYLYHYEINVRLFNRISNIVVRENVM